MAQAGQKVRRGVLGLISSGIQRQGGKIFSSSKLLESSESSQSHLKAFGCLAVSRGASSRVQQQLGPVNNSLSAGHYLLVSYVAKAIRGISFRPNSFSSLGDVKTLVTRELSTGYRSTLLRSVLERPSVNSRLQQRGILSSYPSKIKQEVGILVKEGSIVGGFQGQRAYHVDRHGVQHFKRRGPATWTEKLASQQSMGTIVFLLGAGVVVYVTNRQTVPYTHRKHFMLVSPKLERSIGDRSFQMIMKDYKTRVLPPNHPQSLRVHKIADQIIEALMVGVGSTDFSTPEHANLDLIDPSTRDWDRDSDKPLLEQYGGHTHTHHPADETLDETWVDKSRKDGQQAGQHGYTKHLEGMKWNVVVVDDALVNAICIPGGKIVVFTGLLKKFRSDAEVATVVAHEVGHAVARHSAEALTHNLFIVALQLIVLSVFYVPGLVNSVSELLLRLPFSRRMEIEADHIGLILMAAAGYDPRLAPGFYEKLGQLEKVPEYAQYMSTHPSGKRRGELLRNTATMEEALALYHHKMAGQGTEGFF